MKRKNLLSKGSNAVTWDGLATMANAIDVAADLQFQKDWNSLIRFNQRGGSIKVLRRILWNH